MTIEEEDPAYCEKIRKLFEEFCSHEHGQNLLDIAFLSEKDTERQKRLIVRNRMLRAFEAGYDAHRYGTVDPEVQAEVSSIVNT